MEILVPGLIALGAGLFVFATLAAATWGWDSGLPQASRRALARAIADPAPLDEAAARAGVEAFLRGAIGPRAPFGRFARRAAVAALATLCATGTAWFLSAPELPASFFTDRYSLFLLLRQVALNGAVAAFLVTWASWTAAGGAIPRLAAAGPGGLAAHILGDMGLRLALLAALSAAIFALFARFAGSFGGSARVAVSVVPETLVDALAFRGLSGAQVWAALLTGQPWFLALALRLPGPRLRAAAWRRLCAVLPIENRPIRFLGLLTAAAGAALTLAVAGLLRL